MLLYPRSDANSDDDRLELLADPELAKRLRQANPKFFTRSGHGSIAKLLALAGIVSLVAGYVIEPALFAQHRANPPVLTTTVHHVAPAPPHVLKRYSAAPVTHVKPEIAAMPKAAAPVTEPLPQLQPQKQVQRKARPLTVVQPQPQVDAQKEEQFWLKAQAEARAKDAMRAKALAVTAAAERAAEDRAPAQAPDKTPVDSGVTKITMPQPPVNSPRVPAPVSEPWPSLPGGGPCTPGRGPILVGGHGLTGMIINSVLQNVLTHRRPPIPGRP